MPASTAKRPLVTRLTLWLHGRVQGVGMRWWIRSRALELGLTGWARNLDDGRVEVVAEGPDAACHQLHDLLQPAPADTRPGRIDRAVARWAEAQGLDGVGGSGFIER
jgi:acylphosphatase